MSDIIKVLPDHIANQIAAGEVVQRPASVVKELMENAVDASATHIIVSVRQGGRQLIKVTDNGCGMSPTDARNCFLRHATSKISSAEDLFHLHTKGFRGEALASIAAVAQVELTTRRAEDELGVRICIEGSEYKKTESLPAAVGTTLAVKNLFFNIPARRNFLKSDTIEFSRIADEFVRVALAHPELAFELYRDDTLVHKLSPSGLRRRIVSIFKSNTDNKLVPVEENTDIVKIGGFVYKPQYARAKGSEQFLFVNRRFVKSSYLSSAVFSAFQGLIPERHYPGYFLYFDIDPARIDVNIHPTKTEIGFDDERTIYSFLRAAIRHSLGQYNVLPSIDFSQDPEINRILDHPSDHPQQPRILFDPSYNPFAEEASGDGGGQPSGRGGAAPATGRFARPAAPEAQDTFPDFTIDPEREDFPPETQGRLFASDRPQDEDPAPASDKRYSLINGRYILTHIKTGILLVDPLRAHWRILYEKFLRSVRSRGSLSQQILFPITLTLSPWQIPLFDQVKDELSSAGFHFEPRDGDTVRILGIPPGVGEGQAENLVFCVLDDYKAERPTGEALEQNIARSLSRALRMSKPETLTQGEMETLISDLFECEEPSLSPNGKPTFVKIGLDELEKKFD